MIRIHNWHAQGDGRYRLYGAGFFADVEIQTGEYFQIYVARCNDPSISHRDIEAWCLGNLV